MDLNIQDIKIELIQWITTLDNASTIQKIVKLRKNDSEDWWNEISESEKKSIEQGIEDADAGRLVPHSEAKKVYEKWL